MVIYLEIAAGSQQGRRLTVDPQRPVTLRTARDEVDAGEVVFAIDGARCIMVSSSQLPCTVNGAPQTEAILADGDIVTVGKQVLRVVVASGANLALDDEAPCSTCGGPFAVPARDPGWIIGDHRICRSCLDRGVTPANLPRREAGAVSPPGVRAVAAADASSRPTPPGGVAVAADGEPQRRSRRISASRLAQVETAQITEKPSLLSKVGKVFAQRDARRRLDELEAERVQLLVAAGRRSLTALGGLGLPERILAPLLAGEDVVLRIQDCTIGDLEVWRAQRDRLSWLDAEISAVRAALGIGPDPSVRLPAPPLRADQQERQERAFQTLDSIATEDLGPAARDPAAVAPTDEIEVVDPTPIGEEQGGRARVVRRRR